MTGRVRRNPARFLAPIALVAVAVASYVIVTNGVHSGPSKTPAQTLTQLSTTPSARRGRRTHHRTSYVVKAGDTLSQIALKTGVPTSTLETLNPGINPSALQTGQRLKLR